MLTEQQQALLKVLDLVEEAGAQTTLSSSDPGRNSSTEGNLVAKVAISPQNALSPKPTH